MVVTYQDFVKHEQDRAKWIGTQIATYKRSDEYKVALDADQYERQQNVTIMNFVKMVYDITGVGVPDFTSTNNKLARNFFHRFNVQRNSYLLGNGVSFSKQQKQTKEDGTTIVVDTTKQELGKEFDSIVYRAGYKALLHGVSYTYYNDGDFYIFPMTEFLPIVDEETGKLRAGLRFWSLDWNRMPITVDLYEEEGYSRYRTKAKKFGLGALELVQERKPYKENIQHSDADGDEVIGGENYNGLLPIIPCYGNSNHQSTLIGMRPKIDAYDMIASGYANDEQDVAQIYWLINNASGMQEDDVRRFRDRLLLQHVAVVDQQNSEISAHAQDVPFNSREACLNRIENDLYRDFGALDVNTISATQKTATEIIAAYQPMDEEADDYETQITLYIKQILKLKGIEDEPIYKRNRIVNEKEETEKVLLAADYLNRETVLKKLPFISPDEVDTILMDSDIEDQDFVTEE